MYLYMKNHGSVVDTNFFTLLWNASKNVMRAYTTELESLFNKITGCKPATLLKRDSDIYAQAFITLSETLKSIMKNYTFQLFAIIGFQDKRVKHRKPLNIPALVHQCDIRQIYRKIVHYIHL